MQTRNFKNMFYCRFFAAAAFLTASAYAQPYGYVSSSLGNTVSVLNRATNTVVTTIPISGTAGIAITPDGTRAYVTSPGGGTVSVIDTTTNTVVATIPVGVHPVAIAITPAPRTPTSKERCKHDGYLMFGPPAGPFKNQGRCVSYVNHHQH